MAGEHLERTDFRGNCRTSLHIKPDGHVGDDVSVLRLLGPPAFAEGAKRATKSFVYQPALVDGMPVAIPHTVRVIYEMPGLQQGAHHETVIAYNSAADRIRQGKFDEAQSILTEALHQPRLVFYERGMIANLQAMIALERKDFIGVRELTELPLIFPPSDLPVSVRRNLMRSRIVAMLNLGDIVGAGKTLGALTKLPGADPADPLVNDFVELRRKIDALESFSAPATIPAETQAEGYSFFLYRRYFSFTDVKGELKSVTITCNHQETTSPISLKAEWSVPKSWSNCALLVKGTPGTTFQIVQFASGQPAGTDNATAQQK